MILSHTKYSKYHLCKEMMDTVDLVKNFNQGISSSFIATLQKSKKVLLTGEGSSRIFPAKHFIYQNIAIGSQLEAITDGCSQAMEYMLKNFTVFGVSNSGKTKELVKLFSQLNFEKHAAYFGITATSGTPIDLLPSKSVILNCGKEYAIAATKSVVEQALFFESILYNMQDAAMPDMKCMSEKIKQMLEYKIEDSIIEKIAAAPVIYFSGRNNGVAEELALKTNEIIRKKSVYLEGTYALHGIEEVMDRGEVMVIIEPFEDEERKFKEVLADNVGIEIIAISTRQTSFPTILIPNAGSYRNYVELAAGWNLLVEAGISMGIDLDKPTRARKIGNEV